MIFAIVLLTLSVIFLSYIVWSLWTTVNNLLIDREYMQHSIDILGCNAYMLIGNFDGRKLTAEESFQLAIAQDAVSWDAKRLGLIDPFPRPEDVTSDITPD